MKKFKLIRSEVIPMLITETVEIEANDLKEAIEDVVERYGKVISSDQEEVASIYNIERHADTNTLSLFMMEIIKNYYILIMIHLPMVIIHTNVLNKY